MKPEASSDKTPRSDAPFPGVRGSSLAGLFPEADYRFQMRFQRASVQDFFQGWNVPPDVLDQRRFWLKETPGDCLGFLPEAEPLLREFTELAAGWLGDTKSGEVQPGLSGLATLSALLEPDVLLLKPDEAGTFRLWAGSVCFPSSWSLAEKMGKPLDWIHEVVPGLNQQLGQPITTFLRRMAPGIAWLRANWGLSRSPELNQHPSRNLPRLDASVKIEDVWLRVEHQALVALPGSEGVLFGIRVVVHPLAELRADPAAAAGFRRALSTMPEEMARYKGLGSARASLLEGVSQW